MQHLRWACLTLALTVFASVASATVTVPITLEALTAASDDVVVGTVRRATSQWDGGRIFTDYEIEISATLRGRTASGGSLVARLPGGVVGRTGQTIVGVPIPYVGETYMFFLQYGPSGLRYLTHLTASVVSIGAVQRGSTYSSVVTVVRVSPDPSLLSVRPGTSLDAMARSVLAVRQ